MRWWLLALYLGCGSAPKAPIAQAPATVPPAPEPFWTPKPPPESPLAKLATRRDVFVIGAEAKPSCRRWTIEQSKQQGDATAFLVDGDERIQLENHGSELALLGRRRGDETHACHASFTVREVDAGLDVDGARWFDDERGCERALARKERVAMDWTSCDWQSATLQEQAASQRRFEAMLRFGGSAFAIADGTCQAVHATPARTTTRDYFEGSLWIALHSTDLEGHTMRGKASFGYEMGTGDTKIVLLGPSTVWSDGSSMGLMCGDEQAISYGRDSVELEQTHYLSLASCRAALARDRARRAWLPLPAAPADGEPQQIGMAAPSIGGC